MQCNVDKTSLAFLSNVWRRFAYFSIERFFNWTIIKSSFSNGFDDEIKSAFAFTLFHSQNSTEREFNDCYKILKEVRDGGFGTVFLFANSITLFLPIINGDLWRKESGVTFQDLSDPLQFAFLPGHDWHVVVNDCPLIAAVIHADRSHGSRGLM